MDDSPESNSVESNTTESDSNISANSKVIEVHPLAFTIEFNDQKVDEARKSKVRERLSAFTLKHRRNPSLPDFGVVKEAKNSSPKEKLSPSLNLQHVPVIGKGLQKLGQPEEHQWKSSALKAAKSSEFKNPVVLRKKLGEFNDVKENYLTHLKSNRRNSLSDVDEKKLSCQNIITANVDFKIFKNGGTEKNDDAENKSDTVSEAGTYTVDKEDEALENDLDKTHIIQENEHIGEENDSKKNFQSSWINDWVREVEEQNMFNPGQEEPPPISGSGNSSPGASKIPSPIHSLNRKGKPREGKQLFGKLNGSMLHRRSSSLSAKDYNDNHGSESSLETESFLRATESVVAAMQNRMRLSLDGRKPEKRDFNCRERPHPPSTASDTDTNSETDAKTFKRPLGNPFTSARLNRAFSLRRAKADPEKKKVAGSGVETQAKAGSAKSAPSPKAVASKPPSAAPFSRTDCGRFSMRTTSSAPRVSISNQAQKKEVKKSNPNNRSTSSLSSREVEFQNWRRRKSFDPMKAAAEGRKKELAKKAAMNQSMTQSFVLGNGARTSSGGGNPVLRSASFHSTAQVVGDEDDDRSEFVDQSSPDEQEPLTSPWLPDHGSFPHNSPTQLCKKCGLMSRAPVFNSRCSLISETHSSPSRRFRSNELDNLVLGAISDLSYKLKVKSSNLLKKLRCLYDPSDERFFRLRDEIAMLESKQNSTKNSQIHQASSMDLSMTLRNLKALENVFKVLDDVLFEERLVVYVNE